MSLIIMLPLCAIYITVCYIYYCYGENLVRIVYALRKIIYANLESLYLFDKATGNQEILVQEGSMSKTGK